VYTKKARNLNENSTSPIFFATAKHESRDVEINTQRERDEIYKIEIFVVSCSLSQPQY
jgi:hypothetical protein